jgi:hypothetical protein
VPPPQRIGAQQDRGDEQPAVLQADRMGLRDHGVEEPGDGLAMGVDAVRDEVGMAYEEPEKDEQEQGGWNRTAYFTLPLTKVTQAVV